VVRTLRYEAGGWDWFPVESYQNCPPSLANARH